MDSLLFYKNLILDLKLKVENNHGDLYNHINISNHEIGPETISIIMTSHNRSCQVYFTLQTIAKSVIKDVHIVLVDDSTTDPIDINILYNFPFNFMIKFIPL